MVEVVGRAPLTMFVALYNPVESVIGLALKTTSLAYLVIEDIIGGGLEDVLDETGKILVEF
jgi:hypothetical protein